MGFFGWAKGGNSLEESITDSFVKEGISDIVSRTENRDLEKEVSYMYMFYKENYPSVRREVVGSVLEVAMASHGDVSLTKELIQVYNSENFRKALGKKGTKLFDYVMREKHRVKKKGKLISDSNINNYGPRIKSVEWDSWYESKFNSSLFATNGEDKARDVFAVGLQNFVNSPYIIDDFKDHSKRREWYYQNVDKFDREFKTAFKDNALKFNKFCQTKGILERYFENYYVGKEKEKFIDLISKVKEMHIRSSDKYDEKNIGEKRAYIKEFKNRVINLLDFLDVKNGKK